MFDARFGQDGILERIACGFHLSVMIGFAIVGISFREDHLFKPIFRSTCKTSRHGVSPELIIEALFLMISRLVLAAQYGIVLFHARHHRRGRNSLALATTLHLLPAIAYFIAYLIVEFAHVIGAL